MGDKGQAERMWCAHPREKKSEGRDWPRLAPSCKVPCLGAAYLARQDHFTPATSVFPLIPFALSQHRVQSPAPIAQTLFHSVGSLACPDYAVISPTPFVSEGGLGRQ